MFGLNDLKKILREEVKTTTTIFYLKTKASCFLLLGLFVVFFGKMGCDMILKHLLSTLFSNITCCSTVLCSYVLFYL